MAIPNNAQFLTSTSHLSLASLNMERKTASIQNYGSAINVGEVQVQQQENTIAPAAESVNMKDESQRQYRITNYINQYNTNNNNSTNNTPISLPWPDQPAAMWVQNRSGLPIPSDQVVWSRVAGDFVSSTNDAR